jgi:hypothetical protein
MSAVSADSGAVAPAAVLLPLVETAFGIARTEPLAAASDRRQDGRPPGAAQGAADDCGGGKTRCDLISAGVVRARQPALRLSKSQTRSKPIRREKASKG